MQSDWNRMSYHDGQTIQPVGDSASHRIGYHPIPIKAKIHGAELIAKEKIHINWDDSNFDNYFYDDNDDSRSTYDIATSKSPARAVSIPKYTVVYSAGPGMSSLRSSVDEPGVDLSKRNTHVEVSPSASRQPPQTANDVVTQEQADVSRSSGPRQFSHKVAPVVDIPRADHLFERAAVANNNTPVDALPYNNTNNHTDCIPAIPSVSEYRPEAFPKERHCLSRGSRSGSSCADTERACSPNKQKSQSTYPSSPRASEYAVRNQSISGQAYISGNPDASVREEKPPKPDILYHRNSVGAAHWQQPVAPVSPPHPAPATIAISALIPQQPYTQGSHGVPVPKQAYITAFRGSFSNNMPMAVDQPLSSRSPQRTFSREKRSGTSEPLVTNKARVPQPYQHPPQPVPQQYPVDVSVNSACDEQFYTRTTSERTSPRRAMVSPTNYNALKLQDAVRQADELHSHIIKQSYTKRSTLDDPYSETLARAEAIISPRRAAPATYNRTRNNPPTLSAKTEPNFASSIPQIVDINNRIKEAMALARNAISSQQSDTSARNSISSPTRGISPSNSTYSVAPAFASPISPAGRRQTLQSDGISPSLQLAKKYIDVAGVTRVNYERTISPSRGTNTNVSAEAVSHRMTADLSFRSSTNHYPASRSSNSRSSIDEVEAAKHLTSRIAMQQEGKRIPSSTQNLTIKAASPSRGRQYAPLY